MKVIEHASVYLLSQQVINDEGLNGFLTDHGLDGWESDTEIGSEKLMEIAGRTCYMSFAKPRPGGNEAYLKRIKESAHGSVLEHSVWNILLTGISRSFSHELVRHRAGFGYSQLSQRYVDESVAEYVVPSIIKANEQLFQIWEDAINTAHSAYVRLADKLNDQLLEAKFNERYGKGIQLNQKRRDEFVKNLSQDERTEIRKGARQAARSVLPNATETKVFMTVNGRALRHFIEMRGSRHAEPEIRACAVMICKMMQNVAPNLFGDYKIVDLPDGSQECDTAYRKVLGRTKIKE